MSKKILVNVMHPEESRVAIVEEGRLVELDIEVTGSEQTRGNVYKGVVVRVEPGLQAAFVDIGLKKLGFLQMGEVHPDFWQWRDDVPEDQRKRRPRIQEILRRGQELIVQVEKGERDMKGAALTSYLSLPGRYMVLMPGSDSAGISRKVENEAERKKLKELATQLEIPEGIGYIMRTEALGRTKAELNKDLKSLVKLNEDILAKAAKSKAPLLIYQELDLVIRTIRDYFTAEVDEVLVDSPEVCKQAKAFFKRTMPKYENLVKLHNEKRPIFSRYQLEEQIDQIHEKKVLLKSGGSLVIEPTEALVSIDVNSGKSTGEKGVEDTAFKTNMEAAEEVARQLRLRDLGGLIVIDFIDMRDKKHNADVEKTLKNALKADKARVTVGRISQFGIMEMSRQRIKPTLSEASYLECPHCEGRGKVKSVENMAISFLRKVHAAAAKGTTAEVRGALPLEVAYYLLNRKKRELVGIENDYDIAVTVKGKPSFLMNQLELEQIKREKPLQADASQMQAEAPITILDEPFDEIPEEEISEAAEAVPEGIEATEEVKGKKKRRRKKKGKGEAEALSMPESAGAEAELPQMESVLTEPPAAVGEEPAAEPQTEEQKKKRRRRKRRGAKSPAQEALGAEGEVPGSAAETVTGREEAAPEETEGESIHEAAGEAAPSGEQKKKRRRRKRRSTKSQVTEVATGEGAAAEEKSPVSGAAEGASGILAAEPAVKEAVAAAIAADGSRPASEQQQKRRRTRSGAKAQAPEAPVVEGNLPEPAEVQAKETPQTVGDQLPTRTKPVKKSGTVRKNIQVTSPEASSGPAADAAGPTESPVEPKKKSRSKKSPLPEPVAVQLLEEASPAPEKKARRKKETTSMAAVSTPETTETLSDNAKPKRLRTPRKKKAGASEPAGGE
jgi:ribonuclease E